MNQPSCKVKWSVPLPTSAVTDIKGGSAIHHLSCAPSTGRDDVQPNGLNPPQPFRWFGRRYGWHWHQVNPQDQRSSVGHLRQPSPLTSTTPMESNNRLLPLGCSPSRRFSTVRKSSVLLPSDDTRQPWDKGTGGQVPMPK